MARLSLRKADVRNVRWATIATIVGVVLAAAQLLAARPSSALLASLVAILVLATLLFIVLVLLRRHQPVVVFMNIRNAAEQEEYYERFIECLSNARSVIYYSGRRFSGLTKESESYCLRTADAVRKAVDAGTEYFRIQTGRRVSATWADVYAELVEEYRDGGSPRRGKVKVYEDTDDPTFVNIFITDPTDERTCVVQALFEAERFSGDRPYHQTMGALFLYRNLPIAQGLQRIFVERLSVLPELSPEKHGSINP